jgi:hypothetical protein
VRGFPVPLRRRDQFANQKNTAAIRFVSSVSPQ